jgi:hypothetical protein
MGVGVSDYTRKGVFHFLVTNVRDNVLLEEQVDGTFVQVQGDGVGERTWHVRLFPCSIGAACPGTR